PPSAQRALAQQRAGCIDQEKRPIAPLRIIVIATANAAAQSSTSQCSTYEHLAATHRFDRRVRNSFTAFVDTIFTTLVTPLFTTQIDRSVPHNLAACMFQTCNAG
ncbi:hypothetical protein, partial [Bradyrhizobium sp. ORS 285]|uniref:hypothetical protein n=1 Tax=Bradyrhizobium sp. ORS 285 TaxID=115808 RepID=UPI001AEBEB5D